MSYKQHMKHFANHRKDKHYQQCGFSISTTEKSYATVAAETATGYYVGSLKDKERISHIFPDSDAAVEYFRTLPKTEQNKCGIFTDKGFLIMR